MMRIADGPGWQAGKGTRLHASEEAGQWAEDNTARRAVGRRMGAVCRRMGAVVMAALALVLLAQSCGTKSSDGTLPKDFAARGDVAQVKYIMENAGPDSVARFICLAALGKVEGARIDSLPAATLYAYENLRDSALGIFSDEYDRFSATLPLPDRMKLLSLAGTVDPQGLGYDLGLHYVDQIRSKGMTLHEVDEEIKAFKSACGQDTATYVRFMKGFRVVLELDRGKDLTPEIYEKYRQ